jgi:hypothetical protein
MTIDRKNHKKEVEKLQQAQADLDAAAAALDEANKQEADAKKQQTDAEAGFIMFVVSSEALGLVSRCRIPTAAVAQRGLFRILLGSAVAMDVPEPPLWQKKWMHLNLHYPYRHRATPGQILFVIVIRDYQSKN